MRYSEILHTAKNLTAKNLIFWLFGLVLYGGFNLYTINFFALFSKSEWKAWPLIFDGLFFGAPHSYLFLAFTATAMFFVFNGIKIIFVVLAHNEIHKVQDQECDLCVKVKAQKLSYAVWLRSVSFASIATLALTLTITLATSSIIYGYAQDKAPAVIINIIFIALVTSALGIWNLFTTFFVVLHGMNFSRASKASLDLIVLRFREVIEFVIILSTLYSLAVLIGNAFIYVWQNGIGDINDPFIRITALIMFVLWFALNNTFFIVALLVFFDKLVKTVGVPKEAPDGQLQPNILH